MKKKRRKTSKCLNCDLPLEQHFDYCPSCGQENNNNQVSFKSLIGDFFSNYFSLDSRFGRSLKPFFLKPGELTREFLEGKRVKYANPIRLYLIISLFHFFFFSLNTEQKSSDGQAFFQINTEQEQDKILAHMDSLALDTLNINPAPNLNLEESEGEDNWPISGDEMTTIIGMINNKNITYTVQAIEDSIGNDQNNWSERYFRHQLIKVMKSDNATISSQVIKNIPLAMFFVLPIFALFLKLFFRKRLYINHLIHTLHLHAFGYTVFTSIWIILLFNQDLGEYLLILGVILISLYVVLSFRRTYQVKYATAVAKVILSGLIYLMLLIAMLAIVVTVSFLLL